MKGLVALMLVLVACDDASPPADGGVDVGSDGADASSDSGTDAGPPPEAFVAPEPLTQWVDPRLGTGGTAFGVGSASIAPQRPFGLARPGPDTASEGGAPGFSHCAGYHPGDTYVWGFSQVRMHGTGIADYGNIALMPTDGMSASKTNQVGYRADFDRTTERSEVGYYALTLGEIEVELTAGERVALHRYDFGAASDPTVIVDVAHIIGENTVDAAHVTIDVEAREVRGYSRVSGGYSGRFGGVGMYFVARFDAPFARFGTFDGDVLGDATALEGSDVGAYVSFDVPQVVARVGLSFVSEENAAANLDAEPADFDATRSATVAAWEELLSRIVVSARSESDLVQFYTALYHSLLMPTLASDADGRYRGLDGEVHTADFRYSTDFSLWDTFRTQAPLLSLFYPELLEDQLRSLLAMADDGGYVPRWPLGHGYTGGMVGDSADLVFADALAKGVPFDVDAAYERLRRTAMGPTADGSPYPGRRGLAGYLERGWVAPEDAGWATSATLEFAYDDWGLAAIADAAGASEEATALRARSENWSNLWDAERGFLLGRSADGTFLPADLDPAEWQDFYAEGNANQYSWYVPHDLDGLAERMGGREATLDRLRDFFERSTVRASTILPGPYYWQGNEPDIHAPWIFAHFDEPDETFAWTRWIARTFYGVGVDGLPGNDDSGTLSAWYVFASLGFYPITGASHYLVGAPLLPGAELRLGERTVRIEAPNAGDHVRHIARVSVDGTPQPRSRIEHDALIGASTWRFDLE